jgi:hypothetical protein
MYKFCRNSIAWLVNFHLIIPILVSLVRCKERGWRFLYYIREQYTLSSPFFLSVRAFIKDGINNWSSSLLILNAEFKSKEREGTLNTFSNLKPTEFDISAHYKQFDISAHYKQFDISAHYKQFDISAHYKQFDVSAHYKQFDISAHYKQCDISAHYKQLRNSKSNKPNHNNGRTE